jgi:hypothetical protein
MMNSSSEEFARSPSDPAIEIRDLHVHRGGKVICPASGCESHPAE